VKAVHRLDMDTSGLLIISLNPKAHANLSKQFEGRVVKKTYTAKLFGNVEKDKGFIDLALRCDWPNRPKQMVDHERGKPSYTDYKVLKRDTKTTLVEFKPKTGRSHQLRVHAKAIGHPIIGDRFYAEGEAFTMANRLNLHAQSLTFKHPVSGKELSFDLPLTF